MFGKHTASVLALAAFVAVGVILPDMAQNSRQLATGGGYNSRRSLSLTQTSATPPVGFEFTCPANEEMVIVDWSHITLNPNLETQTVLLNNGMYVTLSTSKTGDARIEQYYKIPEGIIFTASVDNPTEDLIIPADGSPPAQYPDSFITLEITFDQELKDLFISVGDVDSTNKISDATRIRMADGSGTDISMKIASNSDFVTTAENWGYNNKPGMGVGNPGYDHSLYAKADGKVKTIFLDQSVLIFPNVYNTLPSNTGLRGVFPALDFRFCAEPVPATPAPVPATQSPVTGPTPVPAPTDKPSPAVCTPSEEIYFDDFNDGADGWKGIDGSDALLTGKDWTTTTQFLGQYATGSPSPVKVYNVGTYTDFIKIDLDFLELDSWDNSARYGYDTLVMNVNDEKVEIGTFVGHTYDDGKRSGSSDNGIEWTCVSQGQPIDLGGSSSWKDQIHTISAMVPKTLYPDGKIKLSFDVFVSQNAIDESAGFDNISITAIMDCPTDPTAPSGGGVNGDPLIMGLAGQLFKFEGRSGAWYSAVSSNSFQWNMKIQEYEECPADSNKFVSGVGFTLFKKTSLGGRVPAHKIVVNVVNEFGTQTGCGTEAVNCLANGSLELIIDDKKYVYPGDYQLKDGSGRIIAFNTFYECSRKWYDFDVTPDDGVDVDGDSSSASSSLRAGRRLETFPGVFDVVRGLEDTMVDKDACDDWIAERQRMNDLFRQSGEWSTIIVKTDSISFHIEYKQEHKRCNAHTVDVWIASVSPDLYDEEWEGVIGETKDPSNHGEEKVERSEFLKFGDDESYEVVSPFAYKCDGCYKH